MCARARVYVYIYIYIYICVCVCVCLFTRLMSSGVSRCVGRIGPAVSKVGLESEINLGNYSHSDIA